MHYRTKLTGFVFIVLCILCAACPVFADSINAYIDRSAPELAISSYRLDGNVLTITGTAYDRYSGVADISVSVENRDLTGINSFTEGEGGVWEYKYLVPENTSRYGNFRFVAVDYAGNETELTRTDIEIYNVDSRLKYPQVILKNIAAIPEIEGEPVKAVITISGHGYDYVEIETYGPNFPLKWDGYFGEKEAPSGYYLATIRAYNKVGVYTVSTAQILVPNKKDDDAGRYRDVDINGYVDSISDDEIVINGKSYEITDNSTIDKNIKSGDKVTGLGKYDLKDDSTEVVILKKVEDKVYNLPTVEVDTKIGEESFSGIVEAVGDDYIVVNGHVIVITDKTQLNCDFSDIRPGDFVSGVAEIFSQSGWKAIVVNKASTEKVKTGKIAGHVVGMGDGWVEIDVDGMRFIITDATIIDGDFTIGDMILVEYLSPDNEALNIKKLEKAPCTELPAYYYGEVFGIFEDTSEIVVNDLIHIIDPESYYDLDIANLEVHSFAALVDLQCNMRVLKTAQNAGETLAEDRFVGTVKSIGEKDINGNTPVFIDDTYVFTTDKTNIFPELKKGTVVSAVKVGEELISVVEVPDASVNTDDLTDFVGIITKISGEDNHGNRYVTANGITYRITNQSVIDSSIGEFAEGATISGTVLDNSLVHAAVIKGKTDDINPDNTFYGQIESGEIVGGNEYRIVINGGKYTVDENTMVYAALEEKNTVVGVHDKGTFLALRDYPNRVTTARPHVMIGKIEKVSAKTPEGEFSVEMNGIEFSVTKDVNQTGYIAAGMNAILLYVEEADETRTLYQIVSDNKIDLEMNVVPMTGKVGAIGLQDDNGIAIIYIDGYAYAVTPESYIGDYREGDNIIFALSGYEIAAAQKLGNNDIYADPTTFSDVISSISDMQTDGSYIVTLESGERVSLTEDTLLNDENALLEPGVVISGLRFGNMTYIAATYGTGSIDIRDAAFSGTIEDVAVNPDGVVESVTVRHRTYKGQFRPEDPEEYYPGKIVAGSVRPGKNIVSMTTVNPETLEGDVMSIGGYIEKIDRNEETGDRKIVIEENVYTLPDSVNVYGNFVEGARVSFFAMANTYKIISGTVVEAWDQGAPVDGIVENITSEYISNPFHTEDWKHISRSGIHDLMSDDSVELNGPVEVKDTVHGFLFGEEREILALFREDRSIVTKIKENTTAVIAGAAGLITLLGGSSAALLIGGKKKVFSGVLNIISEDKVRIINPETGESQVLKIDKKLAQSASALNAERVTGYTQFGKITKLDTK
ncbi:MAG: hypothetical protein IJI14_11495 [Anaerolineaceae bacterium]|nr:hypothetical protein [Anaerolineaceae bacterium]